MPVHDELIKAYLAIPLSSSTVPLITVVLVFPRFLCFLSVFPRFLCFLSVLHTVLFQQPVWQQGYLDIVNKKGWISKVTDDAPIYN
jgi:hypothetical protein